MLKSTEKLRDLYSKTQMDWSIRINHCLTEPTCPVVSIAPERLEATRYVAWCNRDDVEQTIENLVDRVYREIMLGEIIEPSAPFTNPDDVTLEKLLEGWRADVREAYRKRNADREEQYRQDELNEDSSDGSS